MSDRIREIVSDLTDLFDNRNMVGIIVYKDRGNDEAVISFSGSTEELIDVAATIAAVAAREISVDAGLDPDKSFEMVRNAVDEKLSIMATDGFGKMRFKK